MSLQQATDRLSMLRELRDDLAVRMDVCTSDQNFSVMARVLIDVLAQIEGETGEAAKGGTALDELAAKRKVKTKGTPESSRLTHPAGKAKRGG